VEVAQESAHAPSATVSDLVHGDFDPRDEQGAMASQSSKMIKEALPSLQ
jgi:hypothetical protein